MKSKFNIIAEDGIKWSSIGVIVKSIFQISQIFILTRFLSIESFGLVAMALFVINFTNILVELGFTAAIFNRQNSSHYEYQSIFWFNIICSFIFYFLLYYLAPFISEFYNQIELNQIVKILSLNIIFLSIGRVHRTILQKQFDFRYVSITDIISAFIGLLISIFLAYKNYGIYSLIYGMLASSIIATILFLNSKVFEIKFRLKINDIKPFFKVGGYQMGSSVIGFFSSDIDILIIGKMLGPKYLGLYSLSRQLVLKGFSILAPIISSVFSPLFSSIQNDKLKLRKIYLKVTSLIGVLTMPIFLAISMFSEEILYITYGPEYVTGNYVLSYLAIYYFIICITTHVGSLQIATGKTNIGFKWSIINLILTPLVIYFASLISIEIVAFSRVILIITMLVLLWYIQLKPMIDISLKEFIFSFIKPILFYFFIFSFWGIAISCFDFFEDQIIKIISGCCYLIISLFIYIKLIDKDNFTSMYQKISQIIKN